MMLQVLLTAQRYYKDTILEIKKLCEMTFNEIEKKKLEKKSNASKTSCINSQK